MDLLHDWLAPTIENELAAALKWKEKETSRQQTVRDTGSLVYKDDGSNLRVTSTKDGVVQIIKVRIFDCYTSV